MVCPQKNSAQNNIQGTIQTTGGCNIQNNLQTVIFTLEDSQINFEANIQW